MKCIVIFFTLTGNTEKIARAIQAGVKQAADHCDIVKLQDANPRRLQEYDLIGLGTPVWGNEPDNAKSFIKDMRFVGGKHVFVFCTHGTMPDFYFPSIVPKLKHQGLTVIGMADWYGDCFLPTIARPYHTSGHPDEIDLKEAEEFGREIVERSRRISAGETRLIAPKPNPLPPDSRKGYEKFRSMLTYHKEKCLYPRCRLCMDNCPVYGIDLTRKRPVIAKPCANCEWCIMICPTGALDASDYHEFLEQEINKMSQGEQTPPLIPKSLAKAEAEGRFRRLVPEAEVGCATPLYKLITKHPMWIIGKGLQ